MRAMVSRDKTPRSPGIASICLADYTGGDEVARRSLATSLRGSLEEFGFVTAVSAAPWRGYWIRMRGF